MRERTVETEREQTFTTRDGERRIVKKSERRGNSERQRKIERKGEGEGQENKEAEGREEAALIYTYMPSAQCVQIFPATRCLSWLFRGGCVRQ